MAISLRSLKKISDAMNVIMNKNKGSIDKCYQYLHVFLLKINREYSNYVHDMST